MPKKKKNTDFTLPSCLFLLSSSVNTVILPRFLVSLSGLLEKSHLIYRAYDELNGQCTSLCLKCFYSLFKYVSLQNCVLISVVLVALHFQADGMQHFDSSKSNL